MSILYGRLTVSLVYGEKDCNCIVGILERR